MSEVTMPAVEPVEASPSPENNSVVEPTPEIRKFKVKVNGADHEVDEAELLAGYSTRKAADEKFREAAMTRKQAEEFISMLRTDPLKVLNNPNLGINFKELAEQFLVSQYEEEMLDPRDRELRDAKKQLQAIEDEKKAIKQQQEEQQAQELRQRHTDGYVKDITDTLSSSGLPKTEHTVKRMAYYMAEGLKRGMDLKAADVVDLVKSDYINEQKSLFGALDGDLLIQMLGNDLANKIRKHDVSKVKKPINIPSTPQNQPEYKAKDKASNKISKDDWKAKMDAIKKGNN